MIIVEFLEARIAEGELAAHAAMQSPARALRECEAKRPLNSPRRRPRTLR